MTDDQMTDDRREPLRQREGEGDDNASTRRAAASYPEELYGEAGAIQGRVGPCDAVNIPSTARPAAEALGLDEDPSPDRRQASCKEEQERERIRARTKV